MKQERAERRSFRGHIRLRVCRGGQTTFSSCTAQFLESFDLVKLLQLDKESRREMLGTNATIFASRVYCGQIQLMQKRISEWNTRNTDLARQLSLHEAKDKARNSLLQNVNDQRLRAIIEKHVVRPQLIAGFYSTQMLVDESLRVSKAFLTNYISLYIQQSKKDQQDTGSTNQQTPQV